MFEFKWILSYLHEFRLVFEIRFETYAGTVEWPAPASVSTSLRTDTVPGCPVWGSALKNPKHKLVLGRSQAVCWGHGHQTELQHMHAGRLVASSDCPKCMTHKLSTSLLQDIRSIRVLIIVLLFFDRSIVFHDFLWFKTCCRLNKWICLLGLLLDSLLW